MIILILLLGAGIFWSIRTLNGFTAMQTKISEAYSGIEVALTKRADVLEKLVSVTGTYLQAEDDILPEMIRLHTGMSAAEISRAENRMDALTEQILAEAERNPALSGSSVYQELQYGMCDTELHLEAARRLYNSNVQLYNTAIRKFPSCLLARKRQPVPFFRSRQGVHSDLTITY